MLRLNKVGRFDVASAAVKAVAANNPSRIDVKAHELITHYQHQNALSEKVALETGADPDWFHSSVLFEQ